MNPPYSRAPSGIGFYDGSKFPGWKGNLFVACLRGAELQPDQAHAAQAVYTDQV